MLKELVGSLNCELETKNTQLKVNEKEVDEALQCKLLLTEEMKFVKHSVEVKSKEKIDEINRCNKQEIKKRIQKSNVLKKQIVTLSLKIGN